MTLRDAGVVYAPTVGYTTRLTASIPLTIGGHIRIECNTAAHHRHIQQLLRQNPEYDRRDTAQMGFATAANPRAAPLPDAPVITTMGP